ncbi:MAG: hypothetical protein RQ756_05430 [Flavobacteriaceae bacterium]|nr:hypothetical protein [Flavobacteriaceae bacterium]
MPYKTTYLISGSLKVLITIFCLGFIGYSLVQEWPTFIELFHLAIVGKNHLLILLIFLILGLCSWFCEAKKWQSLVLSLDLITLLESLKQSLAAQSAALMSPARVGEFFIKPFFYGKQQRKTIVGLSILNNLLQLWVTVIMGIIGWAFYPKQITELFSKALLIFILLGILVGIVLLVFKRFKTLKLPATRYFIYGSVWASLKYGCFATQFLLLLHLSGNRIVLGVIAACLLVYLLASLVPVIQAFDAAVKTGIGILLFQNLGIDAASVLFAGFGVWLFNQALPATLGLMYIPKAR